MSNTIRTYPTIPYHEQYGAREMAVTATMQGNHGHAVQFTINGEYCIIAQNQVEDLISVLQKRIKCTEGFSATDCGEQLCINPEKVRP